MDKEMKQTLFENNFYLNWREQTDLKVVKYLNTSSGQVMHERLCEILLKSKEM